MVARGFEPLAPTFVLCDADGELCDLGLKCAGRMIWMCGFVYTGIVPASEMCVPNLGLCVPGSGLCIPAFGLCRNRLEPGCLVSNSHKILHVLCESI